jgi:hypothetical protein
MQTSVHRRPGEPNRTELEHRFADTPGTLAGSWWVRSGLTPWCTWSYDSTVHRLTVTRETSTRTTELPCSAIPTTNSDQRKLLPLLALNVARDMRRSRVRAAKA